MPASSYRQILKSSAFIGGSSVINVFLGVVRNKALAIFIGADGIGLFGAFSAITTLVSGVAGMGVSMSGVRQIAEAVGSNDQLRIARTALVLRRTSLILGIVGMLSLLALSYPISKATFGNSTYAGALAFLSLTILFTEVAGGQTALIQGLRRIGDLAAVTIWGAALGTVLSIPIIFLFREKGIAPFLVTVSLLSILTSGWYVRKIRIQKVPLPATVAWTETKALLGMGIVFMASGLMVNAVAYLARLMIIRQMNLAAAGLYQAAWSLSGVYVSFVLSALGADYYPRLTATAANDTEVNRLVNEQSEASLLMALPGILGTLTFAPWVIHILYSAQFEPAVAILRWQILGVLGRVITWPIGFVLLAKGCGKIYFVTELAANLVHLSFIWFGMKWFGLRGLGMAFFALYCVYGLLIVFVVHRISGFIWTKDNLRLGAAALLCTALVFMATSGKMLIGFDGWIFGALITGAAGFYSIRQMTVRAGYANLFDAWKTFRAHC